MNKLNELLTIPLAAPTVASEESALQALENLPKLVRLQAKIQQVHNQTLQTCCQFFPCYPIEIIRFTQPPESAAKAVQQAQNVLLEVEPHLSRKKATLALPPVWHQNQPIYRELIPVQVIFLEDSNEENADITALIVLKGNQNTRTMTGSELSPGFGLGHDEERARSDLSCQFLPDSEELYLTTD